MAWSRDASVLVPTAKGKNAERGKSPSEEMRGGVKTESTSSW